MAKPVKSIDIFHELMHKIGKEKLTNNAELKKYDYKILQEGKEEAFQFVGLYVVEFILESITNQETRSIWIIKLKNSITNDYINNDKLYHNEHLFYSEVLPALDDKYQSLFPKYVYSQAQGDHNDCVVMEKLEDYGPDKFESFYTDEDHVVQMIQALSKFHASTLILKETNRPKFDDICQKIQKMTISAKNERGQFVSMKSTFTAAADYVEKNLEYNKELLDELREKFKRIESYYEELTTPEEPMSTIVHGDFNKFNLLFKYSKNSEKSLESVKIIDWQIITHASPAVDLSFVIYMNADYDLREKNMVKFLDVYYDTLRNELESHNLESKGGKIDLEKYSRANFIKDFKKFMMQGFGIALGFKAEILGQGSFSNDRMTEIFLKKQTDEYIENAMKTEFLRKDVIEHLAYDLYHVLKFLENHC